MAGTIGGFAATGNGNVLTGTTGAGAAGISVSLALASGSQTTTVTGAQGNVTIADHSLVFQIGANANQTASVAVNNASSTALGLNVAGSQFANLSQVNVQSQSGAQDTIKTVDQAISDVTSLEGTLGAFQNQTLASTASNLNVTLENTTAAQSAIRDTDFAAETANFTKEPGTAAGRHDGAVERQPDSAKHPEFAEVTVRALPFPISPISPISPIGLMGLYGTYKTIAK